MPHRSQLKYGGYEVDSVDQAWGSNGEFSSLKRVSILPYKILTIIGARPQFIKASVVSAALRKHREIKEIVLHTGQHYDENMSDVFFKQLNLSFPDINLNVNGGTHGEMTGRMLIEIENTFENQTLSSFSLWRH